MCRCLLFASLFVFACVPAQASEVASEIWLSSVGVVGGGVVHGVPELQLGKGAKTIYVWGRPQENETLKNHEYNIRSTLDPVLDFVSVTMHNPLLATNPFGPDVYRYEFVADTPEGSITPNVDPDSLSSFQGFTIAGSGQAGVGLGPNTTNLDPLYDPIADAFLIATVEFDVVGSPDSTTELFLQTRGANLDGKGSGETFFVFGDPSDPPLNSATQRDVDSATPDAIIQVVPEPPSIFLCVLALPLFFAVIWADTTQTDCAGFPARQRLPKDECAGSSGS